MKEIVDWTAVITKCFVQSFLRCVVRSYMCLFTSIDPFFFFLNVCDDSMLLMRRSDLHRRC